MLCNVAFVPVKKGCQLEYSQSVLILSVELHADHNQCFLSNRLLSVFISVHMIMLNSSVTPW